MNAVILKIVIFRGMIWMMSDFLAFCVINYKGGTGKTCTLVNLAHGIAQQGYKVLVVDTDPQGSVAYHLGMTPTHTLHDIITQKIDAQTAIMTARPNLDLIASNEHLFPAELFMHQQKNRESILKHRLGHLFNNYNYIFVDCSPSINLINQNVLLLTENILMPVSMDYMTLLGVKQLINNTKILNKTFKSAIKISKIIPTFYNRHNIKTRHVYSSLEQKFSEYISSPIRTNVTISEAAGQGKTIYEFAPSSAAVSDFNKLTEEVLNYER
jgi:chromosome partitioning protein